MVGRGGATPRVLGLVLVYPFTSCTRASENTVRGRAHAGTYPQEACRSAKDPIKRRKGDVRRKEGVGSCTIRASRAAGALPLMSRSIASE